MIVAFWTSFAIVFYTFIGYGILLFLMMKMKALVGRKPFLHPTPDVFPSCAIIIAAYNEELCIRNKIINTISLNYPKGLIKIIVVADGSSDRTVEITKQFPEVTLLYRPERRGKIAAVNRAMKYVTSEVVIFTDANTYLNADSVNNICKHYFNPNVGGVAGEKRISMSEKSDASETGEGLYWKYESTLKRWDSNLNTTVGAAGELFSIRTSLYEPIESDTILDDFIISMRIAQKGYKIVYEPNAYAIEDSSSNVGEELKRKIRIAAGGIQSIIRLKGLLKPWKRPLLTFQYVSHRVLRWSLTPLLLINLLILNIALIIHYDIVLYRITLMGQGLFYALGILGLVLRNRQIRSKVTFIPYYFCVMNYAVILGMIRYLTSQQSPIWEKATRKDPAKQIEQHPTKQGTE